MKFRQRVTFLATLASLLLIAATFIPPLIQIAPIWSFGIYSGGRYFIALNAFVREDYATVVEHADSLRVLWEADIYIDFLDGNDWVGPIDHLERTTSLILSEEPCHPQMPDGYACVRTHLIWDDPLELFSFEEDINLAAEVTISLIQKGGDQIIIVDSIPVEWCELWYSVFPVE